MKDMGRHRQYERMVTAVGRLGGADPVQHTQRRLLVPLVELDGLVVSHHAQHVLGVGFGPSRAEFGDGGIVKLEVTRVPLGDLVPQFCEPGKLGGFVQQATERSDDLLGIL